MGGRILGCVVFGAWMMMASGSLQAHHSLAGVYEMKKEREVSGTLTIIKFVNPHGSLTLAVKNADGTTTEWVFTTGSATTLAERGIGKRLECPQGRGRDHREVHSREERQPARVPQVGDHGRRESHQDIRR